MDSFSLLGGNSPSNIQMGYEMRYMRLLEPYKIGKLELKNRVFMAPMGTGTDIDGGFSEKNIAYYRERAKGGAGILFTAANLATDKYEPLAGNILDNFQKVERLSLMADSVHHYDSKLCVQISAGLGRMGLCDPFTPPCAPSEINSFWFPDLVCRPLKKEEIQDLIAKIAYSATLAVQAGADAIELHAYGGYLLDQFMSSLWNKRSDEYGGDLTGRMKFTMDSIQAIQNAVGNTFPLFVKFTPYHGIKGGRELEEGIEIAKMLEKSGVTALHVDLGCYECWYNAIPTVYQPDGCDLEIVEKIKREVSIPVIGQGKLGDPVIAEKALTDGILDLVGLGHTMLCEPNWVNKVANGFTYDLVPCIGCNECLYKDFAGKGTTCAVNPLCGRETEYTLTSVKEKKKILVLGAGPAGMEAAITAAQRGIEVELWEKSNTLGGNLLAAGAPSFKKDVLNYVTYITNKLYRSNVTVRLSKNWTAKEIARKNFDAIIVACGSEPIKPRITGVENEFVFTSTSALTGTANLGKKNVIVGGGLVGCETALSIIIDQGKEAVIIEAMDSLLKTADHCTNNDQKLRSMIEEQGLLSICSAKLTEIGKGYVLYEKDGLTERLDCDSVILACGYRSNNQFVDELKEICDTVKVIGDSKAPRKIYDAVHEAFHAVRLLFCE